MHHVFLWGVYYYYYDYIHTETLQVSIFILLSPVVIIFWEILRDIFQCK